MACGWPGALPGGLRWLERALKQSSHAASIVRVQALMAAAHLAIYHGDYARAARFSADGVTLARELDEPTLGDHVVALQVGQALTVAGFLAYRQGAYDRAEALATEAHSRLSELGDTCPVPLRTRVMRSSFSDATPSSRSSSTRLRAAGGGRPRRLQRAGNDWGMSDAQATLAGIRYCTGDLPQARTIRRESRARLRPEFPDSRGQRAVRAGGRRCRLWAARDGSAAPWRCRGPDRFPRCAHDGQRRSCSCAWSRRARNGTGRGPARHRTRGWQDHERRAGGYGSERDRGGAARSTPTQQD